MTSNRYKTIRQDLKPQGSNMMAMKKKISGSGILVTSIIIFLVFSSSSRSALSPPFTPEKRKSSIPVHYYDPEIKTVIGAPERYIVKTKDTFLDIARHYRLGFNEMEALYPDIDPWIPPIGTWLVLPTYWVLPANVDEGVIINSAELRLYYFMKAGVDFVVKTFPVGIGDTDWPTPLGEFKVGEKRKNPAWYVPPSLREKYGVDVIPPGPENPLGEYWIRLGNSSYGMHGTDIPWSVGRLVTHGCIRLYPEDITHLFREVQPGTRVKIIYEPVKFGVLSGRIYTEVHKDIYQMIDDFVEYGYRRLQEEGLAERVDIDKFHEALERKDGMPVDISLQDQRL
jgi:L,D-transpeptidase ErfK/SrfK